MKHKGRNLAILKVNPFKERIVKVFSSSTSGDDSMTFEDFLDMMSVFSDNAPVSIKIEYAFRIYGTFSILLFKTKCSSWLLFKVIASILNCF